MGNPSELMTIKAFAEAAGRSQQTIYKQINTRLSSYVHEISGQKYIERRALAEVFKIGENQPNQPEVNSTETNPLSPKDAGIWDEVTFLREQLTAKDRQLEAKDRQIEAQQEQLSQLTAALDNTTKALQAAQTSLQTAQALHAGTMQAQLEAGEVQTEPECQDETAIDVEPGDPEQPQTAEAELTDSLVGVMPEPKEPGFLDRLRYAFTGKW